MSGAAAMALDLARQRERERYHPRPSAKTRRVLAFMDAALDASRDPQGQPIRGPLFDCACVWPDARIEVER